MTSESKKESVLKVAALVADGFEQVELEVPRDALLAAGFAVDVVSPVSGSRVRGAHHAEQGDEFPVDAKIGKAAPADYAALLLPGGVHNPDKLRMDAQVLDFVRHFFDAGKPVAAICHGPWTLIDAGVVSGRKLTSYPSIQTDLRNAGAEWSDVAVVVDRGLITSRSPGDLPIFCKKMLEAFKAGPLLGAQDAEAIAKLGEMIKDIKIAMLTTVEADGTLVSRPMATLGKRFDGKLWFFVSLSSTKSRDVAKRHQVNVSYSEPKSGRYVSVNGQGSLNRDRQKMTELWTPMVKLWFPKGIEDPDLGLMEIDVERAEYWDTSEGGVAGLIGMAKSLLLGRRYEAEESQHQIIELDAAPAKPAPAKAEKDKPTKADKAKPVKAGRSKAKSR